MRRKQSGTSIKNVVITITDWVATIVIGGIIFVVATSLAAELFPDQEWAIKWRFRSESDLQNAEITIDKKPHDCEFMTAPVGNKHCYYQIRLSTTRVRNDQTGDSWISTDDGKTWARPNASPVRPQIFVDWTKVEE